MFLYYTKKCIKKYFYVVLIYFYSVWIIHENLNSFHFFPSYISFVISVATTLKESLNLTKQF
jgi:hypothetical protein